jgi:hypothetical protein
MFVSTLKVIWYTSEWELPVICSVADAKLSFEVHSLRLQLDLDAQMRSYYKILEIYWSENTS